MKSFLGWLKEQPFISEAETEASRRKCMEQTYDRLVSDRSDELDREQSRAYTQKLIESYNEFKNRPAKPVMLAFYHRAAKDLRRYRWGVISTVAAGAFLVLFGLFQGIGWSAVALTWTGAVLAILGLNAANRSN